MTMCKFLEIEATEETPYILLDRAKGVFSFKGRSLPEDAARFYEPIQGWFKSYCENPNSETLIVFELEYFNTSTSRKILEIMFDLEKLPKIGYDVKIVWRYSEDDELIENKGKEMGSIINIPLELQKI